MESEPRMELAVAQVVIFGSNSSLACNKALFRSSCQMPNQTVHHTEFENSSCDLVKAGIH